MELETCITINMLQHFSYHFVQFRFFNLGKCSLYILNVAVRKKNQTGGESFMSENPQFLHMFPIQKQLQTT